MQVDDGIEIPHPILTSNETDIDGTTDAYAYVIGHTIRRFIKCPTCLDSLLHRETKSHFIQLKTFEGCSLADPVQSVVVDFQHMKSLVFSILSHTPHLANLSAHIVSDSRVKRLFCFSFVHSACRLSVQEILIKASCAFYIRVFCTRTNEKIKSSRQQTLKKFKKIVQ